VGGSLTFVPHSEQNLASWGSCFPQFEQIEANFVPHSMQNLASFEFSY
jgi:hypothetical protein